MSNLGYEVMGAAFEVYNYLGSGLLEEIYQESFEFELGLRGIAFCSKKELNVYYKGRELKKKYQPDLLIENSVIVELKAVSDLAKEHEAQILNYMKITKIRVGYLINFAHKDELQWKRFVISDLKLAKISED